MRDAFGDLFRAIYLYYSRKSVARRRKTAAKDITSRDNKTGHQGVEIGPLQGQSVP